MSLLFKKHLPYGKQSINLRDAIWVLKALFSPWLTQGPKITDFEKALCNFTGAKYAVAVTNGTAALHIACLALGIKKGEQGITSGITFVASANAIEYTGAQARFCDISLKTFNLDVDVLKKIINKKTKVIIPVHFAGQPCDMKSISSIAKKNKIKIIEDASHAIGSSIEDHRIGDCKYSDMTTFSFHPVKNMTTGEGGAITTNQKWIYEKLLLLRNHGITKKPNLLTKYDGPWYYEQSLLGFNYRLTDIQCALGISQLSKLEKFNKKRNYLVDMYKKQFINCTGISFQMAEKPIYSAYHLFVLLIDYKKFNISKSDFFKKLNYFGIYPQVHYIPVYHQPYYKKKMPSINLSECEKFYSQAISLPLYPGLSKKDIVYISNTIKNILKIKK